MSKQPKSVLVLSSHVAFGAVGNRAIVFAMETLGMRVAVLPTVTMPWHPGQGPSTRDVPDQAKFSAMLSEIASGQYAPDIGAVLTGYIGSAEQVGPIAEAIAKLKLANPDLIYLCDPVIGDANGLYVPEATATAIRDHLLPLADIITPNIHELGWLSAVGRIDLAEGAVNAAGRLGVKTTVVTSAPAMMRGMIGNLYIEDETVLSAEHRAVSLAPSGTGDLFSALFLARVLHSQDAKTALGGAAASLHDIVKQTAGMGARDLVLPQCAPLMRQPRTQVDVRQLRVAKPLANAKQ